MSGSDDGHDQQALGHAGERPVITVNRTPETVDAAAEDAECAAVVPLYDPSSESSIPGNMDLPFPVTIVFAKQGSEDGMSGTGGIYSAEIGAGQTSKVFVVKATVSSRRNKRSPPAGQQVCNLSG